MEWEPQEGESPEAFAAFTTYRDMGEKRSQERVAAVVGKSTTAIGRWSSRHDWIARAQAWDTHVDREITQPDVIHALAEMRKRHVNVAVQMQNLAIRRIVGDTVTGIKAIDPNTLTVNQVVKLIEAGVTLERLSRGEATAEESVEENAEGERRSIAEMLKTDPETARKVARIMQTELRVVPEAS